MTRPRPTPRPGAECGIMACTRRRKIYYLTVVCTIFMPRSIAWVPRPGNVQQPDHHNMYCLRSSSSHPVQQQFAADAQGRRMQSWLPCSTQGYRHNGVLRGMRKRRRRPNCNLLCEALGASVANEAVEELNDAAHTRTRSQHPPKGSSVSDNNSSSSNEQPVKNRAKGGGATKDPNKLQSVDFTTALMMSRELERTVVPARIENAYQLDPFNLALGVRTLEGNMWLHICWHPKGARCQVGAPPPREKEQKAYTFSQTLRSLVRGLNIVGVGLAKPFERVVRIDLAARLETPPTFRFYVEILASRSNVILVAVDAQGVETVAACAYQVSPSKSVRPLSTGQVYELPPAMTARRPSVEESLDDFVEVVGRVPTQQLKKALVEVYQGTSPMLVRVMASNVPGLKPSTKVGDITPEQWNTLYSGPWKRWLEVIGDGGAGAGGTRADTVTGTIAASDVVKTSSSSSSSSSDVSVRRDDSSSRVLVVTPWISDDGALYYPTTLAEEGGGAVVLGGGGQPSSDGEGEGGSGSKSLQGVMEAYYRSTQSSEEFDGLKRRCLTRVTATLAKLRERAAEFEDQLASAQEDKVAELNRRGDLLTTYGHAWVQGETHVDCVDFDTGESISVEIKPGKTPIETAQEAFKVGKKLKRSASVVRELLDQAKAQVLYAEGIEMALEQLRGGGSREELSVLRGVAEELGLIGGADAVRKFAGAFGVKQVQSGGSNKKGVRGGGGGGGAAKKASGGKGKNAGKGKGGGGTRGAGGGKKESPTAGLLELRRAPGSPAVLVGRNNLQNDRITFSVARAHEVWFHARGVAGAHVLLRLEPGGDAEEDDLAFAADVAVYFSKARQSSSTPVDYVSPKAIKKMGGGGPGMVKYEGAKVMRGEPNRVEAVVAEALRLREEEGAR